MLLSVHAARKVVDLVREHRRALDAGRHPGFSARKVLRLRHEFWAALSGTDIALGATIGERLLLPHPNGVIFHEKTVIGDDCMIMQQVTLGQLGEESAPTIGSNVYIGAGAKVLGPVTIGDGAAIGANAVVLTDVPAGATAVGVPAKIVKGK